MNDISDISNDAIQSQIEKLQAMLDHRNQRSAKPEPRSAKPEPLSTLIFLR